MCKTFLRLTLSLLIAGCELGEINIPPNEPIVVVQAVMRPDLSQQWIIVEQTLTGRVTDDGTASVVPGSDQALQAPIQNATVTVSNINFAADPCGPSVMFTENPPPGQNRKAGVYWAPLNCPTMRAGDTLELRVLALDAVVTARTEIPGVTDAFLQTRLGSVSTPHDQLAFNRDIDTLKAGVVPTHGRALHVEFFQNNEVGIDSARDVSQSNAWFWVDSTEMTLPGDLINLFEIDADFGGGNTPDLFLAGFSYTVTTAFMDENLFDSFRSANFPLSGRGFINRISGGYGLFASLVSQTNELRVIGEIDDPREGTYRVSGVVSGVDVDVELELYVGRQWVPEDTRDPIGAFMTGSWVGGPTDRSVAGWFDGPNVEVVVDVPAGFIWILRGTLGSGSTMSAFDPDGRNVGTVTVVRQ